MKTSERKCEKFCFLLRDEDVNTTSPSRPNLSSERSVYMPPFASRGFDHGEAPYAPFFACVTTEMAGVSSHLELLQETCPLVDVMREFLALHCS